MRVDGFISADAGYEGGTLTTRPITFQGDVLQLNADASAGGSIFVEILDENSKPVPGFTRDEAAPVCGNAIRMPVSWRSDVQLGDLAGQPVKLRFHMRDCKLYAFQFLSGDPGSGS